MKSKILGAAVAVFAMSGGAFAGNMTQPASEGVSIWEYKTAENYCPEGLQPIMFNGAVCCGVPNATGYSEAPAPVRRKVVRARYQSRIPMGKSPDSYDGS
ncbi:MAG: hypothetical protein ACJA06_001393 [Halocynthiibacter sp.]|jgi:hypothetical protein